MSLPETLEADPETGYPDLPEGMVWHQYPPDPLFFSEPLWYNTLGQDRIDQDRIFSLPPSEQTTRIRALLKEHPTKGLEILFKAAVKGKEDVLSALLVDGVNPVAGEEDDETLVPLHAACYNGHLGCAKTLHDVGGVDANARDDRGGTPLMRAAWGAHADIVQWLLENGADPTVRQDSDVDALEFGAGGGSVEVVKAILEHERSQGRVAVTAMALAAGAGTGSEEMLRFLLRRGGYPDSGSVDSEGSKAHEGDLEATCGGGGLSTVQRQAICDAVPRAAASGPISSVRLLLSYLKPLSDEWPLDADWQQVIFSGVLNAASEGDADIVELLLDLANQETASDDPVKVIRTDIINESLVNAAESDAISIIKLLLGKYGADANYSQKPHNVTALYRAAGNGRTEVVRRLIKDHNADIHAGNGRYANGPTALWMAVLNQHVEAVNTLLEFGGPVESVDVDIDAETKEVWLAARKAYRAPVEVKAHREDSEDTAWMRLGYADGVPWMGSVQLRRPDEALKVDGRDMKAPPLDEVTNV